MKYRSGNQFREALEAHLRDRARGTSMPVQRLRKEIVFDRFLARLVQVAPDRWVLKGGLALDHRLGDRARATKDMDIGHRDDVAAASMDLQEAATLDSGDYFSYTIRLSNDLPGLLEDGVAARYKADAVLGGRIFERVVIDVGFGAPPSDQVDYVAGHDLLGFAGIPAVVVPTLPLSYHMAEKVHAYTRGYGESGRASTRVKDLVDIVLIVTSSPLEAVALADALEATFGRRATHARPAALPLPPTDDWAAAYAAMAMTVGLDPALDHGHAVASSCLDPILTGSDTRRARWDPGERRWKE